MRTSPFRFSDFAYAWIVATLLSGIPSTLYALATGGDPLEATRAAGAMLIAAESPLPRVIVAAAVVHASVSFFWLGLLARVLPRRHTTAWAVLAAMLIALLDLRVIAPVFFPEVAALAFWPQFADHIAWGFCVGVTLELRAVRRRAHRMSGD